MNPSATGCRPSRQVVDRDIANARGKYPSRATSRQRLGKSQNGSGAFVDERGAVGIRLKPAAAIVRRGGEVEAAADGALRERLAGSVRERKSGSHWTPRWRGESAAN